MLHDICAGKIIAALFKNIHHRLSNVVASHCIVVFTVTLRKIFGKESVIVLDTYVIFPLRVCRIFCISCGDYVLAVFQSRGLHHGCRRCTDTVEDEQRFPSKLGYFLDGLRREFGGRDANENICTLRLESYEAPAPPEVISGTLAYMAPE